MENKNKKIKVSPQQIEKACEKMGETANAVDNLYGNIKGKLGPMGSAIGFGILITFILAVVNSPGLLFILAIAVTIGAAPLIHKKIKEIQKAADEKSSAKKIKEEAKEEKKEE